MNPRTKSFSSIKGDCRRGTVPRQFAVVSSQIGIFEMAYIRSESDMAGDETVVKVSACSRTLQVSHLTDTNYIERSRK